METEKARAKRYSDFFNLTISEWEQIKAGQDGLCFICRKEPASGIRLATDHCHKTGLIRGLLCNHCNHLIGKIENLFSRYPDKTLNLITILKNIILYFLNPPAVSILGREVFTYPGRLGTKVHRKWLKKRAKTHAMFQTSNGEGK